MKIFYFHNIWNVLKINVEILEKNYVKSNLKLRMDKWLKLDWMIILKKFSKKYWIFFSEEFDLDEFSGDDYSHDCRGL